MRLPVRQSLLLALRVGQLLFGEVEEELGVALLIALLSTALLSVALLSVALLSIALLPVSSLDIAFPVDSTLIEELGAREQSWLSRMCERLRLVRVICPDQSVTGFGPWRQQTLPTGDAIPHQTSSRHWSKPRSASSIGFRSFRNGIDGGRMTSSPRHICSRQGPALLRDHANRGSRDISHAGPSKCTRAWPRSHKAGRPTGFMARTLKWIWWIASQCCLWPRFFRKIFDARSR